MKRTMLWIGALVVGAVLGLLGLPWRDQLMEFIAIIYTRLFQLLAVPTIMLAVISTFATFGSKGSGRIFGRTLTFTLLTTLAAAVVGAVLYLIIAPSNLPQLGETNVVDVYVRYLRSKLDDVYGVHIIQTIRGVGYVIKD